MIQCSNPHCRASSPPPGSRCQTCQSPLNYRFLLAVSDQPPGFSPGTLVADRYWVWTPDIWLDTQPDALVVPLEMLPPTLVPYLRLSALPQHMPRPFTVLSSTPEATAAQVLLLETAPIGSRLTADGKVEPFLLPSLAMAWGGGSALQQLNWLLQIAQLWDPLAQERVTATLLQFDQLRVDQALVRLARLVADTQSPTPVTLANLGAQWQTLLAQAQPEIKPYLEWLVQALTQQDIASAEELVAELDQGVQILAQDLRVSVDWVAYTDQGPERPRNEDACYPEGQPHHQRLTGQLGKDFPLLLVCDGIGGHEQGNVASQTAIKVLLEKLQPLAQQPDLSHHQVEHHIRQALALANDAISDRNNDEHRAARARMGTTVVMALVHFPYVSIAHLGDSRAYRISPQTCYQITLDDDVASRETRLGYTLYSEALQIPNGGALVQALGIADSGQLYPTVQHLLVDDPAVLLLCSDGLSDYDRVDMLWRHQLAPLISPQQDLQSAGQELIQQANQLNGHDNVTVGLLRFTPEQSTYAPLPAKALRPPTPAIQATSSPQTTRLVTPRNEVGAHGMADQQTSSQGKLPWPILVGGIAVTALAFGAAAWVSYRRQSPATALASLTTPLAAVIGQADGLDAMTWAITDGISVGSFWQAGVSTAAPGQVLLPLSPTPSPQPGPNIDPNQALTTPLLVPSGSILKVVSRQTAIDETAWVRLQVCSLPSGRSLDQFPQEADEATPSGANQPDLSRLSNSGQVGWAPAQTLWRSAMPLPQPSAIQQGTCSL